jgi:Flp pilus assembly protein TadG
MLYRSQNHRRRGQVVILVAVCLVVLLSVVAITLDGGILQDDRRRVQAGADAAALAGAAQLFYNVESVSGINPDPGNAAKTAALANAAANGFNNDGKTNTVTVNIPPQSGPFTNQLGYVEVIIQYNQKRTFSAIFGSGDLPVVARAVARGRWAPDNNGILVLAPTGQGAFSTVGNGVMNLVGASLIVDSTDPAGATLTNNATVSAPVFDFSGTPGYSCSGSGGFQGTIYSGQPPTPDPLAYIPEPDPSTMTIQSRKAITDSNGNKTLVLNPGVYVGGIKLSGQANVIMNPGIYYMDGGGFSFTGQGSLTATGVMIYNAPQSNSDVVNISGLGSVNISPPTSGPYKGISIFQERTATAPLSFTGNGGMRVTGTFYAAGATMQVGGNGTGDVIGSQYISYNMVMNGGGQFNILWNAGLTAPLRQFGLVE